MTKTFLEPLISLCCGHSYDSPLKTEQFRTAVPLSPLKKSEFNFDRVSRLSQRVLDTGREAETLLQSPGSARFSAVAVSLL